MYILIVQTEEDFQQLTPTQPVPPAPIAMNW